MPDKNLPLWYSDQINDIAQEGYASILEAMNPETQGFLFLYGKYGEDTKQSMDIRDRSPILRHLGHAYLLFGSCFNVARFTCA